MNPISFRDKSTSLPPPPPPPPPPRKKKNNNNILLLSRLQDLQDFYSNSARRSCFGFAFTTYFVQCSLPHVRKGVQFPLILCHSRGFPGLLSSSSLLLDYQSQTLSLHFTALVERGTTCRYRILSLSFS